MLHFEPTREGEEAGLTVYMDERHHYEIGLTLDPQNGRNVFLRRRVGSLWKVELQESFTGMEIVLGVEANESNYSFFMNQMESENFSASGSALYFPPKLQEDTQAYTLVFMPQGMDDLARFPPVSIIFTTLLRRNNKTTRCPSVTANTGYASCLKNLAFGGMRFTLNARLRARGQAGK